LGKNTKVEAIIDGSEWKWPMDPSSVWLESRREAGIKERLQLICEWLQVSGKPIKLVGRGERMEDLEPFYPDRMAGRILGMGDVLSFVEKAQEVVSFGKLHFIFILKGRKKN
jgi:hypothetical protein